MTCTTINEVNFPYFLITGKIFHTHFQINVLFLIKRRFSNNNTIRQLFKSNCFLVKKSIYQQLISRRTILSLKAILNRRAGDSVKKYAPERLL